MSSWSSATTAARGENAATSAALVLTPGSKVTMARSPPHGMTTVVGVRVPAPVDSSIPSRSSAVADEAAVEVVAERDGERGAQPEPGDADRVDGAAAGRAQEVAREALLAGPGHRLEPDERDVHERGRGDHDVDAHPAKRSSSSGSRSR